jgi:hypothetical protein
MPNSPVKKLAVDPFQHTKIPIDLLKQFQQDAEFLRVPPGSTAGLIRVSPEMIQKMGAAQLTKILQESGCELVIMG